MTLPLSYTFGLLTVLARPRACIAPRHHGVLPRPHLVHGCSWQAIFGRMAGIVAEASLWQQGLEAGFLALAKNNVLYVEVRAGVKSQSDIAPYDGAMATVQVGPRSDWSRPLHSAASASGRFVSQWTQWGESWFLPTIPCYDCSITWCFGGWGDFTASLRTGRPQGTRRSVSRSSYRCCGTALWT